jgi:hypothetical protein
MTTDPPDPESCTQCPHFDRFQRTCGHPLRQRIIEELAGDQARCPVYSEIRADAMCELEARLR